MTDVVRPMLEQAAVEYVGGEPGLAQAQPSPAAEAAG